MSQPQPEEKVEETTEATEEATVVAPLNDDTGLGPDDTLNDVEFAEIIAKKTGSLAASLAPAEEVEESAEEAKEEPAPDAAEEPEETLEEAQQRAEDELPSDATDDEIAAARQEAADQFYVGRYKTREDAERGLSEKDATINRLHAERDQLKAEVERRGEQVKEEPTEIDRGAWAEWATQQIEQIEDPRQAEALAVRALDEGGYDGYEVFLTAWLESEDPAVRARATTFNNSIMLEMSRMRAEAAAAPRHQEDEQAVRRREAEDARALLVARRPDFADMEERFQTVAERLDEETRGYLRDLASQGVEGKARAMEYLYLEAKSSSTESRSRAAAVERQRRETSADADKLAATVTTTEAAPTRTTLTENELKARRVVNARRREWGLELLPEE